jgi:hypothetical protein
MEVESTKNQFRSWMLTTWIMLNLVLFLFVPSFVDVDKSHNLLYMLLNTIVVEFTQIPCSAKTTKFINFLAT